MLVVGKPHCVSGPTALVSISEIVAVRCYSVYHGCIQTYIGTGCFYRYRVVLQSLRTWIEILYTECLQNEKKRVSFRLQRTCKHTYTGWRKSFDTRRNIL